ncbi:hypothetical protein FQN60_005086, partial [Etheostoma spectabile]
MAAAIIICKSVCFMRFVGSVLENQGGAHRRRWASYVRCSVDFAGDWSAGSPLL